MDDQVEMGAAMAFADELDPLECRRHIEKRFSAERTVAAYERAYAAVLERTAARVS